jgi:hypothetical protein
MRRLRAWPIALLAAAFLVPGFLPAQRQPAGQAKPAAESKPVDAEPAKAGDKAAAQQQPAEAAKPAAESKPVEAEPAKADDKAAAPPAEEGKRSSEGFQGSVDVGYRWRSDVRGNLNSYRSVVNLGEGPKLFGAELSVRPGAKKFFDRMEVRANSWGGDPYNTARLDVGKSGVYELSADYRNLAYFNFLPSFANPAIERGIFLNQRSFDIGRRLAEVRLDLRPGKTITPYLAWSHDSGSGQGITDFVSDGNEYPVATLLRDKTDNLRGGVRITRGAFHLTLEQGGAFFKDDSRAFDADRNPGNRTTPLLGQTLFLSRLEQAYGVRGRNVYSQALLSASLGSRLDISGQFLYSRPTSDATYWQSNTGNFVNLQSLLFFSGQQGLATAQAKQPHTSASAGAEYRPFRRLRIFETFLTDRLHNASSAAVDQQILLSGQQPFLADRLIWNYNQQQVDAFFDATSKITLRGGYRYVWGESTLRAPQLFPQPAGERFELRRNVGLAGVTARAGDKLSTAVDYEGAAGDRTYFRTGLQDYQKLRARARYQAAATLALQATFSYLNNQNPDPLSNYDFESRESALSVYWTPGGGKRVALTAEYARLTIRSDIGYLDPLTLTGAQSVYRDRGHSATSVLDVALGKAKLQVGGSLFVSSGSRPTNFYQPVAALAVPIAKRVEWRSEWRWYSLSESLYSYEGFGSHMFVTGLRLHTR